MALPQPHQSPHRKKKPERKKLDVGQFVASENNGFKIESILGSGGFGDVYKVICCSNETLKYAMKTEYHDPRKRKLLNRLKVEMGVFMEIQAAPPNRRKHFIQMIDKGQTEQFKFIVMEIVSHSLEDIRKFMLNGKMTWPTAIKVGCQTLAAISDLHSIGFIHRDIKPHNFAVGRPPLHVQIFMLDFGIARRYVEKDGKIRVPRERVTFLGTVKFASRQCHMEKEQSRMDDLEVWMYMMLELFEQENLIWRRQVDRMQILMMKERMFTHTDILDLRVPAGFKKIIEYIKKLTYVDDPDYDLIINLLMNCIKLEKLDMNVPFDWIDKAMPPKPKKKGAAGRLENDEDSDEKRRRKRKEEKERERREREKEKGRAREQERKSDEDDDDDDDSGSDKEKDRDRDREREREREKEHSRHRTNRSNNNRTGQSKPRHGETKTAISRSKGAYDGR